MAQFAADGFAGSDGSALPAQAMTLGGPWVNGGGSSASPIYSSNRAREFGTTTGQMYASDTPPSADYTVQVDVITQSGGSDSASGVIGRKASGSTATFYLADYYDAPTAGSRQWRLYKFVAGTPTSLGSYTQNLGASATATVKLSMVGSAIKVYVDGVERIAATDSDISSAGFSGVRMGNCASPTTNALFLDNFSAGTIPVGFSPLRRRPSGLYVR